MAARGTTPSNQGFQCRIGRYVVCLSGVADPSDLSLVQVGADTVLWHGTDVLVLKGVTAADLDSGDFIFG